MKIINSINNIHIKELNKLKDKKYRDLTKSFVIEGFHMIEMAKEYLIELLVLDSSYVPSDISLNLVTIVNEDIIKKLSSTISPQPIIGICKYKNEDIKIGTKILMLDDIQDPGNLGALTRTALAFGFETIVVTENTVDMYNDKVIRASQGAIFEIDIIKKDIINYIKELKKLGYKIFGTCVDNGIDFQKMPLSSKYVLILGNEGNGISNNVLELIDNRVHILMSEKIESLNVNVAGAIIMQHLYSKK